MDIDTTAIQLNDELMALSKCNLKYPRNYVVQAIPLLIESINSLDNDNLTKENVDKLTNTLKSFLTTEFFFKSSKVYETAYRNLLGKESKQAIGKIFDNLNKVESITGYTNVKGNFAFYPWLQIRATSEHCAVEQKTYQDGLQAKNSAEVEFDVDHYLKTTAALLVSTDPWENYVGLLAATARRNVELFSTNIFETHSKYKLQFNNLAKKREKTRTHQLKTLDEYLTSKQGECFCLFPAIDILRIHTNMIQTTEFKEKIAAVTERVNKAIETKGIPENTLPEHHFNKIFNATFNSSYGQKLNDIFSENYNIPVAGGDGDVIKNLRKIAALCLLTKFKIPRMSPVSEDNLYFKILGDESSVKTSYGYYKLPLSKSVKALKLPNSEAIKLINATRELAKIKAENARKIEARRQGDELRVTKIEVSSFNKTLDELVGKSTPCSGNAKTKKAIDIIIAHNLEQKDNTTRLKITVRLIQEITNSNSGVIKTAFESFSELIENENSLYNFSNYQNKGKDVEKLLDYNKEIHAIFETRNKEDTKTILANKATH